MMEDVRLSWVPISLATGHCGCHGSYQMQDLSLTYQASVSSLSSFWLVFNHGNDKYIGMYSLFIGVYKMACINTV